MTVPSVLDTARQTLNELADLTGGLSNGATPDLHSLLGIQSRLVTLYLEVGEERTRKFNSKESLYLQRKLVQAKQYQKGRIDLKMTGADATEAALLAVGEDFQREIDAATDFELLGVFLKSIERAIDHSRQVVSHIGKAEFHPQQ